jgi:hypothetical protein
VELFSARICFTVVRLSHVNAYKNDAHLIGFYLKIMIIGEKKDNGML